MLSDKVRSTWVKSTSSQEGTREEVGHHSGTKDLTEEHIQSNDIDQVQRMVPRKGLVLHRHRSDRVKEDLEQGKEDFSNGRGEEAGLEGGGQIGVHSIHSLVFVVVHVIWLLGRGGAGRGCSGRDVGQNRGIQQKKYLEAGGIWHGNGYVCNQNRKEFVGFD